MLTCSNIFMTFAWYGHLKFKDQPPLDRDYRQLGHRLFRVPAPGPRQPMGQLRSRHRVQLKIAQEIITLSVFSAFAILYLKTPIRWNHLAAFALVVAAAAFAFLPKD